MTAPRCRGRRRYSGSTTPRTSRTRARRAFPTRRGRRGGVMEATSLLKKDHAKVKELFKKFEGAGDRAGQTRQHLFDEIKTELDAHAAVEEEIFYPAMQKVRSKEVRDLVLEAIE